MLSYSPGSIQQCDYVKNELNLASADVSKDMKRCVVKFMTIRI